MKERIRELAEQAGGHNNISKFRGHFLPPPPDYIDPATVDLEKFTELIVAECIEVFSKDLPDPTSPDYQLGSLQEVVNRIANVAEHFGVEE